MKKTLSLLLICISLLTFSCGNQEKIQNENDILGWQKIKWGMSKKEIFKIYNFEKTSDDGYTLPNKVTIAGCPFYVMILFDDNDILEGITLADERNYDQKPYDLYKKLEVLLVKKYGMYTMKDGHNLIWLKKSGMIEVRFHSDWDSSGAIVIFYNPKSMALDKYREYFNRNQEKRIEFENI